MVSRARLDALVPQAIGWWGKLPTRGDFVGRGMPRAWLRVWDEWLQRGLAHGARQLGAEAFRHRLLAMPPWQGLILPATPGLGTWCGVVAPSSDRVGRAYPLWLAECYGTDTLDRVGIAALQRRALRLADWLDRIGALSTPKDFEAGAVALTSTPWDGRPEPGHAGESVADLRRAAPDGASFWWQPEPVGEIAPPLVEAWPPRESLVLDWTGAPH